MKVGSFATLFITIWILILPLPASTTLSAPPPVRWSQYTASNQIEVTWDAATGATSYIVEWKDKNAVSYTSGSIAATTTQIQCSAKDGSPMHVRYQYQTASETSPFSIPITFLCASVPGAPSAPTQVSANQDRIIISWTTPSDNGGTPITGYQIYMKKSTESTYLLVYDGQNNPATKLATFSNYNGAALEKILYNMKLIAFNWVGKSADSPILTVNVQTSTSASLSVVSGTGIATVTALSSNTVTVQAKDDTGTSRTTGGDLFFLRITDLCTVTTSFYCKRVPNTNPHFVSDIVPSPIIVQLTDNNDGTYSGGYQVQAKGYVTLSVFLMNNGGLLGEYFDNIWFDGTPAISRIDTGINFDWGTNLITVYAADYVSARWYGKIEIPVIETIMFTLDADDGVRLYLNNNLLINNWEQGPGEVSAQFVITAKGLYDIMIEYIELQGSARIKLYWSSLSIAKEIIPSRYLYSAKHVASSPYEVTVIQGSTVAGNSYAQGTGLTTAVAGKLSTFTIQSADINGKAQDSTTDYYSVQLIGPAPDTSTVQISTSGTYQSNGLYVVQYVPILSGTYSLSIKLQGTSIKSSPYTLVVTPGDIDPKKCTSDLSAIPSMKAGETLTMNIISKDIYGNTKTTGGITDIKIIAEFQNANSFTSPISAPDLDNWDKIYGKTISGTFSDNNDGSYGGQITIFKAASYLLSITINSILISSSPVTLTVNTASIDGSKCVQVGMVTSVVAGVPQTFKIQARDYYSNNIVTLATSLTSKSVTLTLSTDQTIIATGTMTDTSGSPGAYDVIYSATVAGTYSMVISINGNQITNSPFTITVSPGATTDPTKCTFTGYKKAYAAGESLIFTIESRDAYGNLRIASTTDVYNVKMTSSSNTFSVTPVSAGQGKYTVTSVLTVAETYTLTVDISGISAISSPVIGIIVSPGLAQAKKSAFISSTTPITAGTEVKYKIQTKDIYGNVVKTSGLLVSLNVKSQSTSVKANITSTYNIDGYEAALLMQASGIYSVVIKMTQYGGLRATYYRTMDFRNPVENIALNFHSGETPLGYTRIDSNINFAFGLGSPNVITGYPSDFYSIKWEGKLLAPYSEKFKFVVECDNTVRLRINGVAIIDNISPGGALSPSNSYEAYYTLEKNTMYDFLVEYIETRGNSFIKIYWQSDSIEKQIISSNYLYNDLYSDYTPLLVTVNPTTTDPLSCAIINGEYATAVVGVQETITLAARDKYGNTQSNTLDLFSVVLTLTTDNTVTVSGTVTSISSGTYSAIYTLVVPGTYTMSITIKVGGTGAATAISGSPYSVTCSVSNTDPSKTDVSGTGIISATAGELATFIITTKDSNGNKRTSGGDTIEVAISNGVVTLTYNSIQIIDSNNGQYTVNYIITDASASYTVKITINGNAANIIVKTVTAVAGTPSSLASSITKTGITQIGVADTFSIFAKDKYSNILGSNVNIFTKIVGSFGEKYFTATLGSAALGRYDTAFTIDATAKCGMAYIYSYFLKSGIKGNYYYNRWLAGEPALTRIDSTISFLWGTGEIIPGVASDYVGIEWKGYLLIPATDSYTIFVTSNDGIRIYLAGNLIINNYNSVDAGKVILDQSTSISLEANKFYPITIQYFEQTGDAMVRLEWKSSTITKQLIPSTAYYYSIDDINPISGTPFVLDMRGKPGKITSLSQDLPATYSLTSIQIKWAAPDDTGCYTISSYKVERKVAGTWSFLGSTSNLYYKHDALTVGTTQEYHVIAVNSIGDGTASDSVVLQPGVLPTAPASISVLSYGETFIDIGWTIPSNTGYGDTSCPILSYALELNDGFSGSFVTLTTTTALHYRHESLILGHAYQYQVKSSNFLGFGAYTTALAATPKRIPGKPATGVANDITQTTASVIYITYSIVRDNGGSDITHYNIYIDDGLGGAYSAAINNNLLLSFNTGMLSLISGRTYRFKYSATNSEGDGPTSDETSILMAAKPGVPTSILRVVSSAGTSTDTPNAGDIKIQWNPPSDNGGTAITGYKIYLNTAVYSDSVDPTMNTFTISGLTIGLTYTIGISATNAVGEGSTASITSLAAGVPSMMNTPRISSSSTTNIYVAWDPPSFNGGSPITSYVVRRDDGPSTSFLTPITTTDQFYNFLALSISKLYYRIQVAAVNSIGQGPYSTIATFVSAAAPSVPTNFKVTTQSTTEIDLSWGAPASDGGCSVTGYIIYYELADSPGFSTLYDGRYISHLLNYAVIRPIISASKSYRFKIQSRNCGYYSDNVTISVKAAGVPDVPTSLKVSSILSTTSVIISWTAPASNSGSAIMYYTIYKNNAALGTVAGSSTTTYTLVGLTLGNSYKLEVTATNEIGESTKSTSLALQFANVPSSPTSLVLTSTLNSITVSWQAPTISNGDVIRGYKIYMDNGNGGPSSMVYDGSSYPQVYKKTFTSGIQAGLRYYVEVTAINSAGESLSVGNFIIVGEKPSAPYNLQVTSIVPSTSVTLTWSGPTSSGGMPLTKYVLNKNGADLTAVTISPTVLQYADDITSGGTIGTSITYKIKAVNSAGESDYSSSLIVKVGTLPNPPQNFKIADQPSNTSIILQWDKESIITNNYPALGYKIYNKDNSSLLFDGTQASIVLQATINGLTTGSVYNFVVRTVNTLGESGDSSIVTATIGLKPDKMNAVTLDSSTISSITIRWVEPSSNGGLPLLAFIIYYDVGQTGTYASYTETDTSKRTFLKDTLATGVIVSFKVSSKNAVGESALSDISTFIAATVPSAPAIPILTNSYEESANYITMDIKWVEPANGGSPVTGYKLYYSRQDESSYTLSYNGINRPDITSYSFKGLNIGKIYRFKVIALNAVGESIASDVLEKLAATKPSSPRNVAVSATTSAKVTLSWVPPLDYGGALIDSYTIYYSLDSTPLSWVSITGLSASIVSYQVTGLTADAAYLFRMTAVNSIGESTFSGIVSQYASDVPKSLVPLSLISGSRGMTSIGLKWNSPTSVIPITGYILYMDNGVGSDISTVIYDGRNNPSTLTAYIGNLVTGRTYKFNYIALNAAGSSSKSDTFSVIIGGYPDPPASAPTLISSSSTSISYKWNPSSAANGASILSYNVYSNDVYLANVQAYVLSYSMSSSLTPGASYKIQISAVNAIGEGLKSPSSVFYAVDIPSAATLSISETSTDSCTVSWTAVSPPSNSIITGYLIQYDDNQGNGYLSACDYRTNPSLLACKVSGLISGRKITIKVNAFNKAGIGSDSTIACTPSGKPGQPGTPKLVTSTSSSIQVQWDPPIDTGGLSISGYTLFMDEEEVSPMAIVENWIQVYDGTAFTYTVSSGLTAGRKYRFKVQAKNAYNSGVFSSISSFIAGSTPSAIGTFLVQSISRYWANLQWTKPSLVAVTDPSVAGYLIYSDLGNLASYTIIANITNGDQLSYNYTSTTIGATYKFKIVSYNLIGNSADSAEISATFADLPNKPLAPYYVSSVKTSSSFADLTIGWTSPSDTGGVPLTGFKLYMTDTITASTGLAYDGSSIPGVQKFTISGLTLGRKYLFTVSALNPKEGPVSDSFEIYAAGLPGKISGITEIANSKTDSCIGLQWVAPDDGGAAIAFYELYSDPSGILVNSGSTTQAYICQLSTGNEYSFKVLAVNQVGKGTISDGYKFKIAIIPSAPTNLQKSAATSKTQIVIQWGVPVSTGGDSLTGYSVYRKLSSYTGDYTLLTTVAASIFTYTDSTVSSGTSYIYALKAVNSIGSSDYSSGIEISAINTPGAPAAPTLIKKDRYSIRLAWSTPSETGGSPILGYKLYMKINTDYSLIYSGSTSDYLVTGLTPGSSYYFKVAARNLAGDGIISDPTSAIVAADQPLPPINLRLDSRTTGTITIKWDVPNDTGGASLIGYKLEKAVGTSTTYASVTFAGNSNPGILSYSDTGLTSCEIYSYRVSAISADSTSVSTAPLTVIASDLPPTPASAPTLVSISKYAISISFGALTSDCPITSYHIFASTNGGLFTEVGTSSTTTFSLTNIQLSSLYQIKYAGANKVYDQGNTFGVSLRMSPALTVTAAILPQPPENFAVSSITYRDSIAFSWTLPSDTGGLPLSSYTLIVTDTLANSVVATNSLSPSATSFTQINLVPGKSYTAKIMSSTAAGNSIYTDEISCSPGLLPIRPTGIASSSKTRSGFTISWTALTGEDTGGTTSSPIAIINYMIQIKDITTGIIATYQSTSSSYILDSLIPGNTISISIKACTVIGCGEYSSDFRDIAGLTPGLCGPINVNKQSSSVIEVNWSEPSDDGGAGIKEYSLGIEVDGVETFKTGIYVGKYIFRDGIVVGKTYKMRVAAINNVGIGSYNSQVLMYSCNLPQTISSLTASLITQTSATISYSTLTTADQKGYSTIDITYILESASCTDSIYTIIQSSTTLTSFAAVGISPGSCINYRVKTRNNIGDSGYSSILTVIFAEVPSAPNAPVLVSRASNSIDGTYIKVSWSPPALNGGSIIKGYILEQATSGVYAVIYDGSNNAEVFQYKINTGLVAGQTYKYRVSAKNAIGKSAVSAELSVIAGQVPGKVTNLAISSKTVSGSASTITLTWAVGDTGGSPITNYFIMKKVANSASYDAAVSSGVLLTYTYSALNAGVNYTFTVAASNAVYDSNNLEPLSLLYCDPIYGILANVPDQITVFQQDASSVANNIALSWGKPGNGGSPISYYSLTKDNGAGTYYELAKVTSTIFTDTNVVSGSSYNYVIYAVNAAGKSVASSTLAAKAGTKPGIIGSLKVTTQSTTTITITWNAPTDIGGFPITKYYVMHDTGDSIYLAAIDNLLSTTYTLSVTAGQIGFKFKFKVSATNVIGQGDYSSELAVVAANIPDSPTASIDDTTRTLTSATVKWVFSGSNGGSPVLGYIVRRDEGILGSSLSIAYDGRTNNGITSYTLNNLITSRSYIVRVTAVNAVGESSYTDITLIAGTVPGAVAKPTLQSSASSGKIQIGWIAPANTGGNDIIKYKLYISLSSASFTTGSDYLNLIAPLYYEFTGLTGGQSYNIAVTAINNIGESIKSDTITLAAADKPCAPQSVTRDSSTKTSIKITWLKPSCDGNSPITSYKIYLNDASISAVYNEISCQSGTTLLGAPACNILSLTTGDSYNVKVTAINLAGESPISNIYSFIACGQALAPGSPTVVSNSKTDITMSWVAPSDTGGSAISSYEVYYKKSSDPDSSWGLLQTISYSTPTCTHSGNSIPGLVANYKVRAITSYGYGSFSEVSTFVFAALPVMNTPTLVSAAKNSITVSWTISDNGGSTVTGFILSEKCITGSNIYNVIYNGAFISDITQFSSNSVIAGNKYQYKVLGINAAGQGSYSSESSVFIAATKPLKPNSPVYISSTSTTITLKFGTPNLDDGGSPIIKSHLYYAPQGTATLTEITQYNGIDPQYIVDKAVIVSLVTGTIYQFASTNENAIGESDKSDITLIALAALPDAMTIPSVNYDGSSGDTLMLTWNSGVSADSPITGYQVYMHNSPASLVYDGRGNPNCRSALITGLKTGIQYFFYVVSFNANGASVKSPELAVYACTAPKGMNSPRLVDSTKTSLKVAWDPPLSDGGCTIKQFKLFINDGGSGDCITEVDPTTFLNNPSLRQYNVVGLTAALGSTYKMKIVAITLADLSITSDISSFILAAKPDKPPTLISDLTLSTASKIVLKFPTIPAGSTGGSSILGFSLQRAIYGSSTYEVVIQTSASLLTSYADTSSSLIKGSKYNYKYMVKNINGYSDFSDDLTVTLAGKPSTPPSPTISSLSASSITLYISSPSDTGGSPIINIDLEMGSGITNPTFAVIKTITSGDTTVSVGSAEGLTQGSIYTFRTRAKNAMGYSDYSSYLIAGAGTKPSLAPTSLASDINKNSKNSIYLQWNAVTPGLGELPITGYLVEGKTASDADYSTYYSSNNPLKLSINLIGLTTAALYTFRVYALNINGRSDPSTTLSLYSCGLPSPPTNIVSVSTGSSGVKIGWTISAETGGCPLTGFDIYIYRTATSTYEKVNSGSDTDPTITTFDCENSGCIKVGATLGELSIFMIRSKNSAPGVSVNSIPSGQILWATVPDTPSSAPLNDAAGTSNSQVKVKFSAVSNANGSPITSYEVQCALVSATPSFSTIQTTLDLSAIKITGVISGSSYLFQYRAINAVGPSAWSPTSIAIKAAAIPSQMSAPVLSQSSTKMRFTWSAASENGDPITSYTLYIYSKSSLTFTSASANCDGTSATIIQNLYCEIDFSILKSSYGYSDLDIPQAKIAAANSYGSSILSSQSASTAMIAKVPNKPTTAPTKDALGTHDTTIQINIASISGIAASGGSSITSYRIQYDQGSSTWIDLSNSLVLTATVTGLTLGQSYQFRYSALNIIGESVFSDILTVKAVSVPGQVSAPTASFSGASLTKVAVTWTAPTSGGSTINLYKVYVNNAASQAVVANPYCDEGTTLTGLTCTISMSKLWVAPFSQASAGTALTITVQAHNDAGWGSISSSASGGVVVQTLPLKPAINVQLDPATTYNNLIILWSSLDSGMNGGSSITRYSVKWDAGTGGDCNTEIYSGALLTSTITAGISPGQYYKFIYAGENKYGLGTYSDPVSLRVPPTSPTAPAAPDTTRDGTTNIKISWNAPSDTGGSSITAYHVYIRDKSDSTYKMHPTECQSIDVNLRYCLIDETILKAYFNLITGDEVKAKVSAVNADSLESPQSAETVSGITVN